MAKSCKTLAECLCLLCLLLAVGTAHADEGEDLFKKLCASCHTIGGGDTAGPDLKGVTSKRSPEFLVRVISEPEKLTAEKDPTQMELVQKYGMEMPNLGVSRDDAQKIIAFLQKGAGAPAAKEEGAPAAAPVAVTPQLLAKGRDLFTGRARFANGGAPCAACHDLRYPETHGGAYAGELTGTYQKMGESGVRGVLQSLSFPVMRTIYAERPLKQDEVEALTALFKDAAAPKQRGRNLFPLGGVLFFALFVACAILIKRRIR